MHFGSFLSIQFIAFCKSISITSVITYLIKLKFRMNCFVGLDIGTSAIKCILISESGKLLGQAKAKNIFLYPEAGRVEYDADERYNQLCNLIRDVVQQKPSTSQVRAVCITGASGNGLLLNKDKNLMENAPAYKLGEGKYGIQTGILTFSQLLKISW